MDNLKVQLIRSILSHEIQEHTFAANMAARTEQDNAKLWHEGAIEGLQLALNHLEEPNNV
jgi:hypothetical protein